MITENLAELIGADLIHTDHETITKYRFDRWCLKHWQDWRGEKIVAPACVVRPRSSQTIQTVVRYASEKKIQIVPWGLGSGVCGGIEPSEDQILVDMSAMNRILEIDEKNLLLKVEAGISGLMAEEAAASQGLTIGHWPQSMSISSVGGWVSTRASGQFSTAYGNIEDIVYSIEMVLANGELITLGKAPRAAAGPDLRHLAIGAEGTHGIVTAVTLSLRRQPECREFSAWYCKNMSSGFHAQREIVQREWRPPVMRQYDHSEVARLFPDYGHENSGLILLVHEGPKSRVSAELLAIEEIMLGLGLQPAEAAATEAWMSHRNDVPGWRDLFDQGIIADTIEISGTWSQIDQIYNEVIEALKCVKHCVNASAHSSHVYRSGINLYFTFACLPGDPDEMGSLYLESWDKALATTAKLGGGIAHHHGSGRLRKRYLHHDLGISGIQVLRALKRTLDPQGLLNPHNLIPDEDD